MSTYYIRTKDKLFPLSGSLLIKDKSSGTPEENKHQCTLSFGTQGFSSIIYTGTHEDCTTVLDEICTSIENGDRIFDVEDFLKQ